jgi:hypothetical protein
MNTDAQSAGPPELEQPQNNYTTASTRSHSIRHFRGSLGLVGLLVARCRALETRCTWLLLAAHGHSQLLNAARIARCQASGPRNARLLASLG